MIECTERDALYVLDGLLYKADNSMLTLAQMADLLGIAESTLRNNPITISRSLNTPDANGAMIGCLRLEFVRISLQKG